MNDLASPARTPRNDREVSDPDEIARLRAQFLAAERAEYERKNPTGGLSEVAQRRPAQFKASTRDGFGSGGMGTLYALWALLGTLSAHRIYLGAYASALLQAFLFVGGVAGLYYGGYDDIVLIASGFFMLMAFVSWYLADLFLLPGLSRKRDAGEDMGGVFF